MTLHEQHTTVLQQLTNLEEPAFLMRFGHRALTPSSPAGGSLTAQSLLDGIALSSRMTPTGWRVCRWLSLTSYSIDTPRLSPMSLFFSTTR